MEKILKLNSDNEARVLFGNHDEHLKIVENEFDVRIVARGEELTIIGKDDQVRDASHVISQLLRIARSGKDIRKQEVQSFTKAISQMPGIDLEAIYSDRIEVPSKKKFVTPKTNGQKGVS